MSQYSHPIGQSNIPGYSEFPCCKCGNPTLIPSHTPEPPRCRTCDLEVAEHGTWELESLLTALRKGEEPFAAYSQKERLAQLERLGFIHSIHPAPSQAMARTHSLPETVRFETPTAADLDAMADTEELIEA